MFSSIFWDVFNAFPTLTMGILEHCVLRIYCFRSDIVSYLDVHLFIHCKSNIYIEEVQNRYGA